MKKPITLIFAALCSLLTVCTPLQAKKLPLKKINLGAVARKSQLALPHPKLPSAIKRFSLSPSLKMAPVAPRAPIRQSVLAVRSEADFFGVEDGFVGSSFVIEEEYKGQKQLWGITAAHIAHMLRDFPVVWLEDGAVPLPIEFVALGNAGMADIALFPLPSEWAGSLTPLKLSAKKPTAGENTFSFGFFNNNFYLVPNRQVKEVTPGRLVTSLEFETPHRGGACGGPLLNEQGEVVGVHIGSSDTKKVSFAVPSEEITRLLAAYRNAGKSEQPLLFNGLPIAKLNINESIARVRTVTDGYITGDFVAHHQEKEIDYAHLEKLLADQNPDELQIFVSHKAFSFDGADQNDFFFQLTYNFATKETSRQLISALPY